MRQVPAHPKHRSILPLRQPRKSSKDLMTDEERQYHLKRREALLVDLRALEKYLGIHRPEPMLEPAKGIPLSKPLTMGDIKP